MTRRTACRWLAASFLAIALGARTPAEPSFVAMPARPADAFVASMGVDVDLVRISATDRARVGASFAGLHVRHARIAVLERDPPYEASVRAFYAAAPGVTADGLTNCAPPLGPYRTAAIGPGDVRDFIAATGRRLDRIEAVNEPNNRGDADWAAQTRDCVANLAGATGIAGSAPLVAPALVTHLGGSDERALGILSPGVAEANSHRYFSGRDPDTPGWGATDACGRYGALAWSLCWARAMAPDAPVDVTETGWNSEREVDEATQAKYVERVFFVNAAAGVRATSLYTLLSYDGGDGFGGDGLARTDFSPKPAYRAVARIATLLADPGVPYAPKRLRLAIAPATVSRGEGLRSLLLGKRDGSYDLALWQEIPSADPDRRGSDVAVEPIAVSVASAVALRGVAYAWQDDGSAPARALGRAARFTIPVTDRLTILSLRR